MNLSNQIIIYQTEDGQTQVDVRMEKETVWLSISQMAMLFDKEESNIRRHVINVFKEGELERENNVQKIHVNGIKKPVPYYNLDVIISVGYRVKSKLTCHHIYIHYLTAMLRKNSKNTRA